MVIGKEVGKMPPGEDLVVDFESDSAKVPPHVHHWHHDIGAVPNSIYHDHVTVVCCHCKASAFVLIRFFTCGWKALNYPATECQNAIQVVEEPTK